MIEKEDLYWIVNDDQHSVWGFTRMLSRAEWFLSILNKEDK